MADENNEAPGTVEETTAGRLETALAATGFSFAQFGWSHAPEGDYGVWGFVRGADFTADGVHGERGTCCDVHYFTRDPSITPRRAIETALNGLREPWELNTVQFEKDSGFVHYEWLVWMHGADI